MLDASLSQRRQQLGQRRARVAECGAAASSNQSMPLATSTSRSPPARTGPLPSRRSIRAHERRDDALHPRRADARHVPRPAVVVFLAEAEPVQLARARHARVGVSPDDAPPSSSNSARLLHVAVDDDAGVVEATVGRDLRWLPRRRQVRDEPARPAWARVAPRETPTDSGRSIGGTAGSVCSSRSSSSTSTPGTSIDLRRRARRSASDCPLSRTAGGDAVGNDESWREDGRVGEREALVAATQPALHRSAWTSLGSGAAPRSTARRRREAPRARR